MKQETRDDCAAVIDAFVGGKTGEYDWDDFISIRNGDPLIQLVKDYCADTNFIYPPESKGHWCSPEGITKLEKLCHLLLSHDDGEVKAFVSEEMRSAEQRRGVYRR